MAKRKTRNLLVVLVKRVGPRRGSAVLSFAIAWEVCRRAAGDDWPEGQMTNEIAAYCAYWKIPKSTAWRELAHFREALPEYESPSALADAQPEGVGLSAGVLPV